MNYEHKVATIASWYEALASDGYETSTCTPRKIDLPILQSDSCSMNLRDSQGCVGVVGSPSILCKDDSGSGVLYSTPVGYYELIGILSDFQSCAASSFHSEPTQNDLNLPVYTKVNNYLEWILYQTKDACFCNKIWWRKWWLSISYWINVCQDLSLFKCLFISMLFQVDSQSTW